MSGLPSRDLAAELGKHFQGTPGGRMLQALELGRQSLALYLATQPPGTSEEEARRLMRRNKNRGRRPSRVMETGDEWNGSPQS